MKNHNEHNKALDLMVTGNKKTLVTQDFYLENIQSSLNNKQFKADASFQDYWTAWKKNIIYLILALIVAGALSLSLALITKDTYTSEATIKIETDHTRILEYDVDTSQPPSYINDDVFYNTQYKLLRNRELARRVIDKLQLEPYLLNEKKFIEPVYYFSSKLKYFLAEAKSIFIKEQGEKGGHITAEEMFFKNLNIDPIRRSRIVDLHYTSQQPELSQKVLQKYIEEFIKLQNEQRTQSSEQARQYVSEQIEESRQKLQAAEADLLDYARDNKIVDTKDDVSVIANNISLLNEAYIKAKSKRIDAESQYQNKKNISTTLNASQDPVIRAKKQELSSLEAEYRSKLSLFKPAYPEMQELKQQIDQLNRYINSESKAIGQNTTENMHASYIATLEEERKLKREIDGLEAQLLKFHEDSIGYTSLQREVNTSRNLYDGLLQRLKEINVAAPVQSDNITVIDKPELPPRKDGLSYLKYLILGTLTGLFLYTFLIFLKELLVPKIRNESSLKLISPQYPILSSVPKIRKNFNFEKLANNKKKELNKVAESFRFLRTSLQIKGKNNTLPQVLHITSPNPGEGKSTNAILLAHSLSATGKKVLLIDGDLRKPSIHKKLGLTNQEGLTNFIYEKVLSTQKYLIPNTNNFFITLTAGPAVADPVDALNSKIFKAFIQKSRSLFDHIIIDSPPVLGLADSLIISNMTDKVLLVLASNQTAKRDAVQAIKILEQGQGEIAGIICNKTDNSFSKSYYNTKYSDGRAMLALQA